MPLSADKTRIYVDRTVTPNKGITLDEIAVCLKDFRKTRFGRDIGLLATSPNINMSSKHKPVVWPSWTWSRHDHPMHYRGSDGRCGINYWTINQYDVMGGLVSDDVNVADRPYITDLIKSRTSAQDMSYRFIKGGASEPARFLDFDGYDHKADSIWNIVYKPVPAGEPDVIGASQFTVGSYAYASALSNDNPSTLALIDIMQGLKAEGDTSLVVYELSGDADIYNYSFVCDYDIDNGKSYGYIGMLAAVYDDTKCYGVAFCSKSVGSVVGDDLQTFTADAAAALRVIGAYPERKLMLIPVVCNYSTAMNWVVFSLDAMPHFKAIPFPLNKQHYKEFDLSRGTLTIIKTTLSAFPENTEINGTLVYAPNAVSGGLDLVINEAVYGSLTARYTQGTTTLGETSVDVSGAAKFSLGGWNTYNTSDLFYKATGIKTGLYPKTSGGPIYIELSYSIYGTTDQWTEQVESWYGGDSRIIIMR